MHPILFQIGSYSVPTYGVVFSTSILIALILCVRRARVDELDDEKFIIAATLGVLGILVGSKLMHIIVSWEFYAGDLKRLLDFRKGHIYYGGYFGGVIIPLIYLYRKKEPIFRHADIWLTYSSLGLAIHRAFGCIGAGCCFGKPTAMPWGIVFPAGAKASIAYGPVPVHPTQLYESLLSLSIFLFLLYWRKYRQKVPGELFTFQITFYLIGRFVIEFFRGDKIRGFYGPLSTSQWVSIGLVALSAGLWWYIYKTRKSLIPQIKKARS